MKIKTEEKHLDKEWIEMTARLQAFLETADQEHLHKFRVQIKKLRAMLTLFEAASKEPGLLKTFKPVKKIFKKAGVIRDAHIHLQLAEHYNLKNERFEADQRQVIDDGTADFRKTGEILFKELKTAHKKIKQQLPKAGDEQIAEYYKMQLEQIAAEFASSGFGEEMHTNRKFIKILMYNHKIAADALRQKINLNVPYLDQLQEAIGKWHDNLLAEQFFRLPELNDQAIVNRIKKGNAAIKRNISKLARDFLQKAVITDQ